MNRPKVIVHADASIDGRITLAPGVLLLYPQERWQAISPPSEVFNWLKSTHQPDSYLEGSYSFLAEGEEPDPLPIYAGELSSLYQDFLPEAIVERPGKRGWFTAVDSRGRIRWLYKEYPGEEWKGWYPLVLVCEQTPANYLSYLQCEMVPYLVAGKERVNLSQGLEKMARLLGIQTVLSTSPGKLGGALLRAGLVDELSLDFFPAIIGGTRTPSLFESPELLPDQLPTRLDLLSAHVNKDGRVWLRYQVEQET